MPKTYFVILFCSFFFIVSSGFTQEHFTSDAFRAELYKMRKSQKPENQELAINIYGSMVNISVPDYFLPFYKIQKGDRFHMELDKYIPGNNKFHWQELLTITAIANVPTKISLENVAQSMFGPFNPPSPGCLGKSLFTPLGPQQIRA